MHRYRKDGFLEFNNIKPDTYKYGTSRSFQWKTVDTYKHGLSQDRKNGEKVEFNYQKTGKDINTNRAIDPQAIRHQDRSFPNGVKFPSVFGVPLDETSSSDRQRTPRHQIETDKNGSSSSFSKRKPIAAVARMEDSQPVHGASTVVLKPGASSPQAEEENNSVAPHMEAIGLKEPKIEPVSPPSSPRSTTPCAPNTVKEESMGEENEPVIEVDTEQEEEVVVEASNKKIMSFEEFLEWWKQKMERDAEIMETTKENNRKLRFYEEMLELYKQKKAKDAEIRKNMRDALWAPPRPRTSPSIVEDGPVRKDAETMTTERGNIRRIPLIRGPSDGIRFPPSGTSSPVPQSASRASTPEHQSQTEQSRSSSFCSHGLPWEYIASPSPPPAPAPDIPHQQPLAQWLPTRPVLTPRLIAHLEENNNFEELVKFPPPPLPRH